MFQDRLEYRYLPTFVASARKVLETMAATSCYHQKPEPRENKLTQGDVTGIIEIKNEALNGRLIISFDKECITDLASKILGEKFEELSPEVIDTADEITNMISGCVRRDLSDAGHVFDVAVPEVVVGREVEMTGIRGIGLSLPFLTEAGSFTVEAEFDED